MCSFSRPDCINEKRQQYSVREEGYVRVIVHRESVTRDKDEADVFVLK